MKTGCVPFSSGPFAALWLLSLWAGRSLGRLVPPPRMAQIEITNRCNLSCRTCTRLKLPQLGDMPYDDFVRLIDSLEGVRRIWLSGQGEPLLHPDLPRMIRACAERGIRDTIVHTNGMLLHGEMAEGICVERAGRAADLRRRRNAVRTWNTCGTAPPWSGCWPMRARSRARGQREDQLLRGPEPSQPRLGAAPAASRRRGGRAPGLLRGDGSLPGRVDRARDLRSPGVPVQLPRAGSEKGNLGGDPAGGAPCTASTPSST